MSASREAVRDRINELTILIEQAQTNPGSRSDGTVSVYEEEKRRLLQKLSEMNEHTGTILTDSPVGRAVLKG